MPGLLSSVFDDGDETGQAQSHNVAATAGQDIELNPEVDVSLEMGGSYQNLDGSTTTWSNSQDVSLNVDVDGTVDAVLSAGIDQNGYEVGG